MLIGITGFIGAGKDTVAKMLVEKNCVQDSFAAPLKDLCASVFGWPRHLLEGDTIESREFRETPDLYWTKKLSIDSFTPRLALQLVGTDVMRDHFNNNIWLNSLEYRIRAKSNNTNIVISDARFRNELDLIRHIGGVIVNVSRTDLPDWYEYAYRANVDKHILSRHVMKTRFNHVHLSEWDWVGYDFDYEIKNIGTLADLQERVDTVYSSMFNSALRVI
jgi:hypothetical protein